MDPSRIGRPGVAGLLCRGVPRDDRRKAGVREVADVFNVGENSPGFEKRTLFDLRVDGVLACTALSEVTRGLTGDIASLLLFGFRRAIGTSRSDNTLDAIIVESSVISDIAPNESYQRYREHDSQSQLNQLSTLNLTKSSRI